MTRISSLAWRAALLMAAVLGIASCRRTPDTARVVVYCAHDREFADPLLKAYQERTGVEVMLRFDTEANKSVGLYEDLIREAARPRCDVHWNNEILAAIRLQQRGLL